MPRFCLTDAQWVKMEPFCLGKPSHPGRTGSEPPRVYRRPFRLSHAAMAGSSSCA